MKRPSSLFKGTYNFFSFRTTEKQERGNNKSKKGVTELLAVRIKERFKALRKIKIGGVVSVISPRNVFLIGRLSLGMACIGVLAYFAFSFLVVDDPSTPGVSAEPEILGSTTEVDLRAEVISANGIVYEVPEPRSEDIEQAEVMMAEKIQRIKEEEERKRREEEERRMRRINTLSNFLASQGSPMAPYAGDVLAMSERCGIDYKLFLAIAWNESGLGKVNFRPYNAWGYGQYGFSNWSESTNYVGCKIATNFIHRGYNTPEKLAGPYGAVDQQEWAKNIRYFMARIPSV